MTILSLVRVITCISGFSLKVIKSALSNRGQGLRQPTVNSVARVGDWRSKRLLLVFSMQMGQTVATDDEAWDCIGFLLQITANVNLLWVVPLTTHQHASAPWQCRVYA